MTTTLTAMDITLSLLAALVTFAVLASLCGALGATSLGGGDLTGVGIVAHLVSVLVTQSAQVAFSDVGVAVTGPDIIPNLMMSVTAEYMIEQMDDRNAVLPTLLVAQALTSLLAGLFLLLAAWLGLPQRIVERLSSSNRVFSSIVGFVGVLVIRKGISVVSQHRLSMILAIPVGLVLLIHKYQKSTISSSGIRINNEVTSLASDIVSPTSTAAAPVTMTAASNTTKLHLIALLFLPLFGFWTFRLIRATFRPKMHKSFIDGQRPPDPWVFERPAPSSTDASSSDRTLLPFPLLLWFHSTNIQLSLILHVLPICLVIALVVAVDAVFKQAAIYVGLGLKDIPKEMRFNRETNMAGCAQLVCALLCCPPTYAQLKLALLQNSVVQNFDNRLAGILLCISLVLLLISRQIWDVSLVEKLPRFWVGGILIYVGGDLILDNTVIKLQNASVTERRAHAVAFVSALILMVVVEAALAVPS